MPTVFTIDGSTKQDGGKTPIPRGECRCVINPRTGRHTKICKDESGKVRIKGKC